MNAKFSVVKGLFAILLTLFSTMVFSQEERPVFAHLDEIDRQFIPVDTAVRKGVLDNGLTYYVLRHDNPKQKAFFQLLVRGGSILEKDNEQGIAHFVEHVLFKGTKHFPGDNVVGFMRRNGIPFGHDSNAFTGFNTVRYVLNSIPTDNESLVDSCLLLLRDWAGDAIIDKKGVESEHNVIVEEWRMRNRISFAKQMQDDLLDNSFYAKRQPIGDMEIVRNCSPKLVRNFYKRWYQPQNQAVVVIGDFEPDEMVSKIRDMFGDMKRGKNIVPAPPTIPDFEAPHIRFYQDKQLPYNTNLLLLRLPEVNLGMNPTIGDLRIGILREKIKDIMKGKLEALRNNNKDLYDSEVEKFSMGDILNKQLLSFGLSAVPERWSFSLESLAKQIEIIRRKGFKDDDWKEEYPFLSPAYNADSTAINFADTVFVIPNNDHVQGSSLADQYADAFFKGRAIMSSKAKQMVEHHLKNTFTQEQLHQEFLNMTDSRNMMIALMFPEGTVMPDEKEVLSVLNRVKGMSDEELAEVEVVKAKKLERIAVDSLDIPTIPGTVKKTTVLNDSISEVFLSNGVKVVFWKTKTTDNRINFMFRRPSGYSVLNDDEIHFHDMLSTCVRQYSYWGGFGSLCVEPFNDIYDITVVNMEKVEACLKMVYSTLTSTEVDVVEFEGKQKDLQASAVAMNNPILQTQLRLVSLPALSNRRLMPPTVEEAATYNIDRFREVVKEYYSNYNGSVLLVQGEYDTDSIMPHILKYIASLPSKPEPVRRMDWPSDHYKTTDSNVVEKIENATPYCATFIIYTWEKDYRYTQETHAHNQVLQSVLKSLLISTLRMQHSDIYSLICVVNDDLLPVNRMMCCISYTCNPTQRERIAQDAMRLVQNMVEGDLITKELIDSYVKEREKKQNLFKDNDFSLRSEYLSREIDGIVVKKGDVTYIKQVTPASLKAHLKNLLKKGNLHVGYLTTE